MYTTLVAPVRGDRGRGVLVLAAGVREASVLTDLP